MFSLFVAAFITTAGKCDGFQLCPFAVSRSSSLWFWSGRRPWSAFSTLTNKELEASATARKTHARESRVVAIGDVHGDLTALTTCLKLGGLISHNSVAESESDEIQLSNIEWKGGNTKVVLVGDLLDRGDDEIQILWLLEKLREQARQAGGAVITLLGNHEVMNVLGDFRYTTTQGNAGFLAVEDAALESLQRRRGGGAIQSWDDVPSFAEFDPQNLYPGLRPRKAAFMPGGLLARGLLRRYPVAAVIDSTLFVHGAFTRTSLASAVAHDRELPLRGLNRRARDWVLGKKKTEEKTQHASSADGRGGHHHHRSLPPELAGASSVVWSRAFSGQPPGFELQQEEAEELQEVLKALKCERMVVGHTPQCPGGPGINGACGGALWRVDVGMSKMMGGRCEVLEITTHVNGSSPLAPSSSLGSTSTSTSSTSTSNSTSNSSDGDGEVPGNSSQQPPGVRTTVRVLSADFGVVAASKRMAWGRRSPTSAVAMSGDDFN